MWYTVSLLFRSVHNGEPRDRDLWEEIIYLVQAEDDEDAEHQAECLGKAKEHEDVSLTGELVRWVLHKVESVCRVESDSLTSGTELFSRFLNSVDVQNLLAPLETGEEPNGYPTSR